MPGLRTKCSPRMAGEAVYSQEAKQTQYGLIVDEIKNMLHL